jgi:signal transduction histidine kinase
VRYCLAVLFTLAIAGLKFASQPGMGIGLYVSRAIAAGMGARLFIEESSSLGTVFAIEIPLAPVEAEVAPDLAGIAD